MVTMVLRTMGERRVVRPRHPEAPTLYGVLYVTLRDLKFILREMRSDSIQPGRRAERRGGGEIRVSKEKNGHDCEADRMCGGEARRKAEDKKERNGEREGQRKGQRRGYFIMNTYPL